MMKPILTAFFFCVVLFSIFAQPVVSDSWVPQVDDVWNTSITFETPEPGESGANVVWDFSDINTDGFYFQIVFNWRDPATTPYFDSFPDATVCADFQGIGYGYYSNNSNGFEFLGSGSQYGFDIYSDPQTFNFIGMNFEETVQDSYELVRYNDFTSPDTAEAIAQPGDVMLLHEGNYGGTIFFNTGGTSGNHIVLTCYGDGEAVFEGIRIATDYIWLDGLTIVDQVYGLRTSSPGPKDIVITRCHFENNHYGIYLNDGGSGWYIADNTITGDNIPGGSDFSGEGIELWRTNGHTVAHNTISRTADGISYPGKNVDMFGNDIFDLTDDGIEFDYGLANNRAWKNRITNAFNNGISFQPQNGAPYYVLYNQVSVLNSQSVLKLRDRSDRALIAHNTFVCNSGPMSSGSNYLVDFEIKNNLWISINDRYAWENGVLSGTTWKTDFDHNGFDWGNYQYAFKWGERLDDVQEFYDFTGQELNGIEIDYTSCIDSIDYAGNVDSFYIRYYTLADGCNALDAGVLLSNINIDYVGAAPDLGAYESGLPLPKYGVRQNCYTTKVNAWSGPAIGSWYGDPSYWALGRFPDVCDEVSIPSGVIVTVMSGAAAICHAIELGPLAEVKVEGNGELLVGRRR